MPVSHGVHYEYNTNNDNWSCIEMLSFDNGFDFNLFMNQLVLDNNLDGTKSHLLVDYQKIDSSTFNQDPYSTIMDPPVVDDCNIYYINWSV